ncbi:MAG TPA: FTR1 family protein [Mariprofundaceae bacterium]|nr:FTR1 family protein [Mariprofundaceae bacterium]
MISSLVIVFREMLEMSLVIGILLAATRGLSGSRRWIWLGMAGGVLGAVFVAIFMGELESSVQGNGEFLFNAFVLLLASVLIAWTVFWMTQHGRELSAHMRQVGEAVKVGRLPYKSLAVVSLAAVMREGSEAAFFLFGASQAVKDEGWTLLVGGILGAVAALLIGALLYYGLVRIPVRRLLGVAGWLLMLLAAGMASQAAWNLVAIDWLPPLVDTLWNSSGWLPQDSFIGEMLHVLVGYDEAPSGMQFAVFAVALLVMGSIYYRLQTRRETTSPES